MILRGFFCFQKPTGQVEYSIGRDVSFFTWMSMDSKYTKDDMVATEVSAASWPHPTRMKPCWGARRVAS